MTKTKIAIASLLAVGFATSAFASEPFLAPNSLFNQPVAQQQTQRVVSGTQAYAYAPAQHGATYNGAEQREFNRVDIDTVSAH